jgi:hypothetical protein
MPVCTLDKRALEKIKMKAMKAEIKRWVQFDHSNRWNFGIIDTCAIWKDLEPAKSPHTLTLRSLVG